MGRVATETGMTKQMLHILAWPVGLLLLGYPLKPFIDPWLQLLTAWGVTGGLALLQIPYASDGGQVLVSSGKWMVAPDCGGFRYLLPGLAIEWVVATMLYTQWRHRAIFLGWCAVALLLTNVLRALWIIVASHWGWAYNPDHRMMTYGIYEVTLGGLAWGGWMWRQTSQTRSASAGDSPTVSFGILPRRRASGLPH
jgi:exosortase